jgi:flavin reductase (DIM6/NTAB) family NADH-FMN oxidoreductase RutF
MLDASTNPSSPGPVATLAPAEVLSRLVPGRYLLTASFAGHRAGILTTAVSVCGSEPPLICVAVVKGHDIDPLIRDARHFGVCLLSPDDRLSARRFAVDAPPPASGDPFECFPVDTMPAGAPVLRRASLSIECEVFRHIDLETDHELFIGLVLSGRAIGDSGAGK